jgi:hypothetical protein
VRKHLWLAALAFAIAAGPALAESPQGASPQSLATERGSNPKQTVQGVVTKVDQERRRVTIRDIDGADHEFEASSDTLKDMKVGDRIEARRRDANQARD